MKAEEIFQSNLTAMVLQTLEHVRRFCGEKVLIKIGGASLENPELVKKLCNDLSLMRASGISLVLVHGGGKAINRSLEQKGIGWEFHNGQRKTSEEMIDTVEEVLCGHVNKKLVRTLNSCGVKAVGLSGSDGGLLECSHFDENLGEVGKIDKVNASLLEGFLEGQQKSNQGFIPVVSTVGATKEGRALNINADYVCMALASALQISKVIYLTDEDGILNAEGHLISSIDKWGLVGLIESGAVKGGMLTKVRTVIEALDSGVQQVHIINGSRSHSLIEEVFTNKGVGTVCQMKWENSNA